MTFSQALSVIPVSDIEASTEWYERLIGMPPTNIPMPGLLAEWRVTDTGWIQVTTDNERAGTAQVNLAVDDLDRQLEVLAARHIAVGDTQEVSNGVRLAPIVDPDGNVITLIGNFREVY